MLATAVGGEYGPSMRLGLGVLMAVAVMLVAARPASAAGFDCMRSLSDAQATTAMGVSSKVVAGGGGVDDCGVNARGYTHVIVTGYTVPRSFFDRLRRNTRSGRRAGDDGAIVEYTQRTLGGFGGPAFSLETRTFFEGSTTPAITRSVFVYRNGRMLRPTTPGMGGLKTASIAQLVRLARVANRGI
jgi:hypothetical protein